MRVTRCEVRVTRCELRVACCVLRVTGCEVRVAGFVEGGARCLLMEARYQIQITAQWLLDTEFWMCDPGCLMFL